MAFFKKHPYITWQLIGWGIVLAALLYMMFNYDNSINIPVVVFTIIGGAMAIMLSPAVIYLTRRNEKQKYRWIKQWYTQKHGKRAEVMITLVSFFIFVFSEIAIIRSGWFFLSPFAVYAAAPPYLIWRQYVIRKFYQVPHAEQYCKVIPVRDADALDAFFDPPTLIYMVAADEAFFNFTYNYYHYFGILKKQEIRFYQVERSLLNVKYGFRFVDEKSCLYCITADDIVIDKRAFQCYPRIAYLYSSYIDGWQRIFKMKHTDFIKLAIHDHIFSDDDLGTVFWRVTGSEAETEELVAEMQSIKKISFELAGKVCDKSISQEEACEMILQKYDYLSKDEAAIVLEKVTIDDLNK